MPTVPCGNANTDTCCPPQVRIICFGLQIFLWTSAKPPEHHLRELSSPLVPNSPALLFLEVRCTNCSDSKALCKPWDKQREVGSRELIYESSPCTCTFLEALNRLLEPEPCMVAGRWLWARSGCLMRKWQPAAGSPSVTFRAQQEPQGCSSFLLSLLTWQEKSQEKNKDTFGMHWPRQFQMSAVL